jgi:hypothetical protein
LGVDQELVLEEPGQECLVDGILLEERSRMAERQSIRMPVASGSVMKPTNHLAVPVQCRPAGVEGRHRFREQRVWVPARIQAMDFLAVQGHQEALDPVPGSALDSAPV